MTDNNFAAVRLIEPDTGATITIPLPTDGTVISGDAALSIKASLRNLIAAGFAVTATDLTGTDEMEVNFVVRGQVKNDDRITDRIWFYAPWGDPNNGAQLTHYLNTPEDIIAFEAASGLKVSALPLVDGRAAPAANTSVFRQNAKPVTMKLLRRKEDDKGSPVGYKWALVKYASGAAITTPTIVQRPAAPVTASDPDDLPIPSDDILRAAYPGLVNQLPGDNEGMKKKNMKAIVWALCQGANAKLSAASDAPTVVAQVKFNLMPGLAEASGNR